jgi:hypothetical protein
MSEPTLSIATSLNLVRQTYRQVRYSTGRRADAEQAALDTYCSLHPDASEAEASEAVAKIIRVSSEAGLIWIEN